MQKCRFILLTASNPGEAPRIDDVPRWDNIVSQFHIPPFNISGLSALFALRRALSGHRGPFACQSTVDLPARFEEAALFFARGTL